ncbi:hypothetical protein OQJ46_08620 [Microbulbifer thermotolerans]|uniref:hypothetical protein n=1 Tax=Microbulbifer thermotolerans TaxID=252514 RepID=UPI00224A4AE7|nr:hypothetical protein [Microbulbifer thermotolerans]MCX2783052.1 hypothetical protein [Microbulbifer thermotolerans]
MWLVKNAVDKSEIEADILKCLSTEIEFFLIRSKHNEGSSNSENGNNAEKGNDSEIVEGASTIKQSIEKLLGKWIPSRILNRFSLLNEMLSLCWL